MPRLYGPGANLLARATAWGLLLLVASVAAGWVALSRSPYVSRVGLALDQPVMFSHEHHVGGLGIDCRYCHGTVETQAFAGMPSLQTCMTCHSQMWTNAPMLAPVREGWQRETPLIWQRVHDLPDFVQFHHGIHVSKGVACETCHGRVDRMPLLFKTQTLFMKWCLDCHRHPGERVGSPAEVFWMEGRSTPQPPQPSQPMQASVPRPGQASQLAATDAGILPTPLWITNCSVCHY